MKKIMKLVTVIMSAVMLLAMLPGTAMADGSYYVDSSYIVLKPGQTATITIGANNAAGRVDWTSSGAVTASGTAWLDNGVATIDVTGTAAGTGYITVYPTDIATYDGEAIDYSYTIQVDVVGEDGYTDGNNAEIPQDQADAVPPQVNEQPQEEQPQVIEEPQEEQPQEEQPQEEQPEEEQPEEEAPAQNAADEEIYTDGNEDFWDLPEEERLYTTVNDQELYIIQFPIWLDEEGAEVWNDEVYNLDRLSGFDLITINYKGMNVDGFQYKDQIRVFVLKNLETDQAGYYQLENGKGFSPLSYIAVNGKQYIVVDFPTDFEIPEGYQMVDMTLGSNTVHALRKIPAETAAPAQEEPAAEEEAAQEPEEEVPEDSEIADTGSIVIDKRTKVMLNGYETQISPGLDTVDPSDDLYYIYCLVDGKTQLYSYDSGEGTLQRAAITVYKEIPTEPETVIVYETVTPPEAATTAAPVAEDLTGIGWNNMQIQMKVLLIALAVAILLIIILIILFAAMSRRNKKRSKAIDNRSSRRGIPPRTTDRGSLDDEENDGFFSYVKTETDDFDLEDLK